VQLPFVPQGVAANKCDARNEAIKIYCLVQKNATAKFGFNKIYNRMEKKPGASEL